MIVTFLSGLNRYFLADEIHSNIAKVYLIRIHPGPEQDNDGRNKSGFVHDQIRITRDNIYPSISGFTSWKFVQIRIFGEGVHWSLAKWAKMIEDEKHPSGARFTWEANPDQNVMRQFWRGFELCKDLQFQSSLQKLSSIGNWFSFHQVPIRSWSVSYEKFLSGTIIKCEWFPFPTFV